jgi:hypothetical protein
MQVIGKQPDAASSTCYLVHGALEVALHGRVRTVAASSEGSVCSLDSVF